MSTNNNQSRSIMTLGWLLLLFCLVPFACSLNTSIQNASQVVGQYHACLQETKNNLPSEDAEICCMPGGLQRTVQHRKEMLIPFSNETLIVMESTNRGYTFLVFLFMTPCMLLLYGLLIKDTKIIRIGIWTVVTVCIVAFILIIYSFATFKDS